MSILEQRADADTSIRESSGTGAKTTGIALGSPHEQYDSTFSKKIVLALLVVFNKLNFFSTLKNQREVILCLTHLCTK